MLLLTLIACQLLAADVPPQAESAHRLRPIDQPAGIWEFVFDEVSRAEYARQLDYFKVEVAAVSDDGLVEYIANVSRPKPDKRIGDLANDDRWHFGWKTGTLLAADRDFLAKAGISVRGKQLQHFFPNAVQVRMAELERQYQNRPQSDILSTRFQIQPVKDGDGYEIVVVKQELRRGVAGEPPSKTTSQGPRR